jgi:3-hydroxyacyl-CoA dehydrogenase/enoyl-CoA hydratase/3-hydroxybutyryl-CoA epimerase
MGLTEVNRGLMPSGGGVVRLVSLVGFEDAVFSLLNCKKINVEEAMAAGIIDESVPSIDEAVERAKEWIDHHAEYQAAFPQPWDRPGFSIPGIATDNPTVSKTISSAYQRMMAQTRGLYPAQIRVFETAVSVLKCDFDTALKIESQNFVSLLAETVTRNIITFHHVQKPQIEAGASRPEGVSPFTVRKLGIIGAGMMGQGIACSSSMAGISVVLNDISLEMAEKGKQYTAKVMDAEIARGRLNQTEKADVLGRIVATQDRSELDGCDLVVETVFEDLRINRQMFGDN